MSFYSDNKNFINMELHHYMKGLSDGEKLIQYESIKPETRKRLKSSYNNCDNVFGFYEEAFNHLSFYDLGFLLINLFFEKNASDIFLYLSNGTLSISKINHRESFSSNFYNDMKNTFSKNLEVDFLKLEFTKLLDLKAGDWKSVHTNLNEVVKKYALWLMEINKKNIQTDLNIYSYFLFCKIWNSYDSYRENFSAKAIIFYNTLNKKIEELLNDGFYIDLNQMISELKNIKDDLFIEDLKFYPLLDREKHTSRGFVLQRTEFNKYVKLSKTLSKSYSSESFESIFDTIHGAEPFLCRKLENEINKKLDRFHIPTQHELVRIINKNLEEKKKLVLKRFLKRLYIY